MPYDRPDLRGYGNWVETGVGTNAGVSVTHALKTNATKGQVHAIDCSGDAAALVTIESPAGTVLWRKRFTAAFNLAQSWTSPLPATASQSVLVKISASTSNCEAQISGYDV